MTLQVAATPKRSVRALPRHYYGGRPKAASQVLFLGEVPSRTIFRPCVTIRWGRRGRGKSVSLTAEGRHFQAAYQQRGLPFLVAANYQNDYADVTRPHLVEELIEFPEWGWRLRILLDEISLYLHRRRWMNERNLNFEAMLQQVRKRSIEVSMATQFPQRLDTNIVDQIDLFIDCELVFKGCGHPDHRFCIMQRIHDWWGQWTGKTWRKPWPPNPWDWDYFKWFHNCDQFFGAFDTEQVFAAPWLPGSVQERILSAKWGDPELWGDPNAGPTAQQRIEGIKTTFDAQKAAALEAAKDWDEYSPDLEKGKPGTGKSLADFLRSKAMLAPDQSLNAAKALKVAQEIDPNLTTTRELISFCRGAGWGIEQDGNITYVVAP